MDIAGMSTGRSMAQVYQQVDVSLMKKVMNMAEQKNEMMMKMLETNTKMLEMSVSPHVGGNFDLRV